VRTGSPGIEEQLGRWLTDSDTGIEAGDAKIDRTLSLG